MDRNRIDSTKSFLQEHGIDVMIIPTEDPHLSEYPADHWKLREYISGFTGSNGLLILSKFGDGLWTDSRYYLQAEKELDGSSIILHKEEKTELSWKEWLRQTPPENSSIGLNDTLFSQSCIEEIIRICEERHLLLNFNVILPVENDLPPLPDSKLFIHNSDYNGLSYTEKRNLIFQHTQADYVLLCSLDEIAWTFNLRASDTPYNPVAVAYAIVGKDESYFFVNNNKLTDDVTNYFNENNIICLFSYESIFESIQTISEKGIFSVDPNKTNHHLYNKVKKSNLLREASPIEHIKCIKTSTELENIQNACLKDGIALTYAFAEIEQRINERQPLTENDIAIIAKQKRSEQTGFFCESFSTIAAYGSNGAIVHYNADPSDCATIGTDNLLLVDSGANYLNGTTDITRVFCYGTPTEKQKSDYTLVLKGHIAIATCRFPKGTEGAHINVLAHQYLWKEGLDYGHGTGHGIGFFLCVHEGPQRINNRFTGVVLREGMVLSDEPGLYREGEYGIRIENMVSVEPSVKNEFGEFLQFKTLTLFPYERKLIQKDLLTQYEITWINNYHQEVFNLLSPHIKDNYALMWLKNVTKEL